MSRSNSTWAQEYEQAYLKWHAEWAATPPRAMSLLDDLLQSVGLSGTRSGRRERAATQELNRVRNEAKVAYFLSACDIWRQRHPNAPSWMLPVVEELPSPEDLEPATSLQIDPRDIALLIQERRKQLQPPLRHGEARFPGSGTLRAETHFDIAELTADESEVFERWFAKPDYARLGNGGRRGIDGLTCRRLSSPGLVWRQHQVRPDVDGIDLRTATPGTQFELPYPPSCRSIPTPMGSIMRVLPDRALLREGHEEKVIYLEIWVHTGIAFPRRPTSAQFENEVLLPARSCFEVLRHVDMPYQPQGSARPTTHTHAVQIVQLS